MLKTLRGGTALVTGASKRLGSALALALAEEGVNVVVHYSSSAEEAEKLRWKISELDVHQTHRVKAWTLKADFSDPAAYSDLIARARDLAGGLDILVNNASVFSQGGLGDMSFNGLARDVEINAWAPFSLTREFARLAGGSVLNLLDAHIAQDSAGQASYMLSKRLLAALTRSCALEYAPGVRVNAVAPGLILPPEGRDDAYLHSLAHAVPLNRHGGPEDICAAALYLLKSDFVTGQTIFVDGGNHLVK